MRVNINAHTLEPQCDLLKLFFSPSLCGQLVMTNAFIASLRCQGTYITQSKCMLGHGPKLHA